MKSTKKLTSLRPSRLVQQPLLLLALLHAFSASGASLIGLGPRNSNGDSRIYGISTSPFSAVTLADTSITFLSGFDFDLSGNLYATEGSGLGLGSKLYSINTTTWATNLVGSTGYASVSGLSFDTNGTLYGTASDDASPGASGKFLITLNPLTGASTLVGAFAGATTTVVDALAINSSTGVMYGTFGSNGSLFTINKADATVSLLGALTDLVTDQPLSVTGVTISGLDFDPVDGTLYASTGSGDGRILSINPNTLKYSFLGDVTTGSPSRSITSVAVVVPEPSVAAFLLGVGFMATLRRRR